MGSFSAHLLWAIVIKISFFYTYIVDFTTKVNISLGVCVFLDLHTKRKRCGQKDPPHVISSQVVSACQLLRFVAPFFFYSKSTIWALLVRKGVWPYGCAHNIHLVTLILNIYGFMSLTLTVQAWITDTRANRQTNYLHFIV